MFYVLDNPLTYEYYNRFLQNMQEPFGGSPCAPNPNCFVHPKWFGYLTYYDESITIPTIEELDEMKASSPVNTVPSPKIPNTIWCWGFLHEIEGDSKNLIAICRCILLTPVQTLVATLIKRISGGSQTSSQITKLKAAAMIFIMCSSLLILQLLQYLWRHARAD